MLFRETIAFLKQKLEGHFSPEILRDTSMPTWRHAMEQGGVLASPARLLVMLEELEEEVIDRSAKLTELPFKLGFAAAHVGLLTRTSHAEIAPYFHRDVLRMTGEVTGIPPRASFEEEATS